MEIDKWTNTKTNTTISSNGALGSPRGWVGRAVEEKLFFDSASMKSETTLDHREISCGAIFPRGMKLPDFGRERVLYRFFHIPKGYNGAGGGRLKDYHEYRSVIGVALAVKPTDFFKYEQALRASGAEFIWFGMPTPIKTPDPTKQRPAKNASYDYEQIYAMLDKGLRNCEIMAKIPGSSDAAIAYIKKRWKNGLPPTKVKSNQVGLDHEEVVSSYNAGESAQSIADRLNTTRQGVYYVLQKYNIPYKRTGTDN